MHSLNLHVQLLLHRGLLSLRVVELAYRALEGIVSTMRNCIQQHSADIVDLSVISELEPLARQLKEIRGNGHHRKSSNVYLISPLVTT